MALFKARPSPFYILDEVEAALDDTNLGRLLEIYEELRETSQLIVITHQKRTMEVADALYGVTMRGDGVSAVISQRLREAEPRLSADASRPSAVICGTVEGMIAVTVDVLRSAPSPDRRRSPPSRAHLRSGSTDPARRTGERLVREATS